MQYNTNEQNKTNAETEADNLDDFYDALYETDDELCGEIDSLLDDDDDDCIDLNVLQSIRAKHGFEISFEVKEKYREILLKMQEYNSNDALTITDAMFSKSLIRSIDINTCKLNMLYIEKDLKFLVMGNKAYIEKKIQKIKDMLTDDNIEYTKLRESYTYEMDKNNIGTKQYDIISEDAGAITIGVLLNICDKLHIIDNIEVYPIGSKVYMRISNIEMMDRDYMEFVYGMLIGTLGKPGGHKIAELKNTKNHSELNMPIDIVESCLTSTYVSETSNGKVACEMFRIYDILSVANSRTEFQEIYNELKNLGISELNIPLMDMSEQKEVYFKVKLSEATSKMMKDFKRLDKILLNNGVIGIREIYERKFKQLVFSTNIGKQFLTYNVMNLCDRDSIKQEFMYDVIDEFGSDSWITKKFKEQFSKSDHVTAREMIEIIVVLLDNIEEERLEDGEYRFRAKINGNLGGIFNLLMEKINAAGNKVKKLEIR